MFFRIILCLLCLPSFLLVGAAKDQNTPYSIGAIPSWVKSYDFPLDIIPAKPSQVNLQYLLIDKQKNWEEKTFYYHFAIKMLTKRGVEKISQLKIDFDPAYYQVVVHDIRVFRDGKWLDRLKNARHNLIQREADLEQNLYNGDLTLVYFLEDIREGDIVEYSYSIKGSHPLFSSHYTDRVYTQWKDSVEKVNYRFLGSPNLSFLIKPINTVIEPKICDLSPSLREWCWEASNTAPYSDEADQPIWYDPPAHIEMSQYQNWEEVVKKLYPLYSLPPNFVQSSPLEMQALIEQWKSSTSEVSERALLALRFVQDQIRYLGIEEGMGAFQPTDPCLTFQRRFGDCKDKTFLLHALLQLMNISSTPLLVNTIEGRSLPNSLPSPFLFDHLVLQVKINNTIYYVDPTLSLQGGSLQTNFFPGYEWGLLVSNDSKELISLPKVMLKNPTEIDTVFTLESEDVAHLQMKSVVYESKADLWRRWFEKDGLKNIEENSLSTMQEFYGAVTLDAPMEVKDDRENNILTLIESYRLPTQTFSDEKLMEVFSYTLRNYLNSRINPERASPCQIHYPLWVKEHIHVENPFNHWEDYEEDYKKEHESLSYRFSTRFEKNKAVFDFELKHLQDHIPKHSLRDYWQIVNEIEQKAPSMLTIAKLSGSSDSKESFGPFLPDPIILLCIWPMIYLFRRKKRATQDIFISNLKQFQNFYAVINVVSVMAFIEREKYLVLVALWMLVSTSVVCNLIIRRRSAKMVLNLQVFLILQACFLTYFLFAEERIQAFERNLDFCALCLYFGSFFILLNKARQLLLNEKMPENAVV